MKLYILSIVALFSVMSAQALLHNVIDTASNVTRGALDIASDVAHGTVDVAEDITDPVLRRRTRMTPTEEVVYVEPAEFNNQAEIQE